MTGPWPRPGDPLYSYDSEELEHERARRAPDRREIDEEHDEDEVLRRIRDGIGEL